jgi:hypothetical protein
MLYHLLRHFRGNKIDYLTAFFAVTIISCSIGIFFAEPMSREAPIFKFGDTLWQSISTITTVACGDVYSGTIDGKICLLVAPVASCAFSSVRLSHR